MTFLAVETLQNGRIETPGQTLDDLIGIDRSIDDFFLFVQVHLLFRSTAWSMGATDLQSPKCGMREADPALRQDWPPKFFCAECRNTRPSRPPAPNTPFWAGSWAGGADSGKTNGKKWNDNTIYFCRCGREGAWGGKFSLPCVFFIEGVARANQCALVMPDWGTMRTLPRLPLRVPDCTSARLESADVFPESLAQFSVAPGRCEGWVFARK